MLELLDRPTVFALNQPPGRPLPGEEAPAAPPADEPEEDGDDEDA
jgi:hypothetical protein